MQWNQFVGLALPMKILVWESTDHRLRPSCARSAVVAQQYSLNLCGPNHVRIMA